MLAVLLSACATQPLNFTMEVPATVHLEAKGVGTLAVATFEDRANRGGGSPKWWPRGQVLGAVPDAEGRHRLKKDDAARQEVMPRLVEQVVRKLAAEPVPHPVKVERVFETDGWFGDPGMRQGIELIKANRPEDAMQSSAAFYSLGVPTSCSPVRQGGAGLPDG